MSKPVSPEHALYIGAVFGLAMRNGIRAEPVVDEDGDYTDQIVLRMGYDEGPTITLVVPPPPDDWTIDEWLDQ
jgi:hypothetical protein